MMHRVRFRCRSPVNSLAAASLQAQGGNGADATSQSDATEFARAAALDRAAQQVTEISLRLQGCHTSCVVNIPEIWLLNSDL